MPKDALEQLLRTADATAPAPPLLGELLMLIRRRQSRRRRNRVVARTAAMLVIAMLVTTLSLRPSRPPQIVRTDPREAARQLRVLDLQAALHEQTAAQLVALRQTSFSLQAAESDSVLAEVREQRDRAALVLIYEAEQAAREKQTDRALAAYRRTIDLFPTTYWASVARQRLKEMPT